MGEEIFRLDNVAYSYGRFTALESINLSIEKGDCLAVLGANGSGKSTLLKILDALIFPTRGTFCAFGAELKEDALKGDYLKDFRMKVGFVFQEPDVQLFSPTVFDELAFGPLQLDMPPVEVKKRVEDLMEMLGLVSLRDRPPYTLSGGEKKKVAIASVLSLNPEVLLLDEPTNGLDPRTQVWLIELVEELKKLGKTFVITTHDLSLVEDLTERVVVLDESHTIVADGPSVEVLRDRDMLLRANIIHEHAHRHGDIIHTHSHGPFAGHDEHD